MAQTEMDLDRVHATLFVRDGDLEKVKQAYQKYEGDSYRDLASLLLNLLRFSTCNRIGHEHAFKVVSNIDDTSLIIQCNTPAKPKLRVEIEYNGNDWDYLVQAFEERVVSGRYSEVVRTTAEYVFGGTFMHNYDWA